MEEQETKTLSMEEKMAAFSVITGQEEPDVEQKPNDGASEGVNEGVNDAVKEEVKTPEFDVSLFNKTFGKEFEKIDDIKSIFDKVEKGDELQKSYEETAQQLAEYKRLSEQLDPLAHFVNKDEYIRQQFLKLNGDKLGETSIKVLSALSPSKIKDMDVVDALRTDLIVNKGLDAEEADAVLARKYDSEDLTSDDLDKATKGQLKIDVIEAKQRLTDLYKDIKVPEKTDWETTRQQLKDSWTSPTKELVNGIDKIEIEEGVFVAVDAETKDGMVEEYLSSMVTNGIKPSETAMAKMASEIRDRLLIKNIDRVIQTVRNDQREKDKAEFRAEVHNDKPLKTETKLTESEEDNNAKIMRLFG